MFSFISLWLHNIQCLSRLSSGLDVTLFPKLVVYIKYLTKQKNGSFKVEIELLITNWMSFSLLKRSNK